jgi:hypothetical protein
MHDGVTALAWLVGLALFAAAAAQPWIRVIGPDPPTSVDHHGRRLRRRRRLHDHE